MQREQSNAEWFQAARSCNQRRRSDADLKALVEIARKQRAEAPRSIDSQDSGDGQGRGRLRAMSVPAMSAKEDQAEGEVAKRPVGVPGMPPGFGANVRRGVPGMPAGFGIARKNMSTLADVSHAVTRFKNSRVEVKAGDNDLLQRLKSKKHATIE